MSGKQAAIVADRRVLRKAFDCIRYDTTKQALVSHLAGALGGSREVTPALFEQAREICSANDAIDLVFAASTDGAPMRKHPSIGENSNRWLPEEEQIVREFWPDINQCVDRLPKRNANTVYLRARLLGLTRSAHQ